MRASGKTDSRVPIPVGGVANIRTLEQVRYIYFLQLVGGKGCRQSLARVTRAVDGRRVASPGEC